MRIDLRIAALLSFVLAGLAGADAARRWLDAPLPLSVAAGTPTPFDVPGIPLLRPVPFPWHPRNTA